MQEQRFYSVMKEQEYITCFVMNTCNTIGSFAVCICEVACLKEFLKRLMIYKSIPTGSD